MDTPEALERIAERALRDLGAGDVTLTVTREAPDSWRLEVTGSVQMTLTIRAGAGTSAQFVREQIIEQFPSR